MFLEYEHVFSNTRAVLTLPFGFCVPGTICLALLAGPENLEKWSWRRGKGRHIDLGGVKKTGGSKQV